MTMEFLAAVHIRRTKFDELVKDGKIRVIKKLGKSMCRRGS